jgi:hypothetical protein
MLNVAEKLLLQFWTGLANAIAVSAIWQITGALVGTKAGFCARHFPLLWFGSH